MSKTLVLLSVSTEVVSLRKNSKSINIATPVAVYQKYHLLRDELSQQRKLFNIKSVLSHLVIIVIVIEVNVLSSGGSAVGLAASRGILLSRDEVYNG